ncbi:hypothetical protein Vafri_6721 [Volvox africanus]|uniref:Uncharacterized protein n=1 Tax=Volvox africanus TaxID=51714 RepID=A0A8J4B312_9CHLO|nr:hypothetical protein Vafri_6721 [Volvox africanus]
MDGFCRSQCKCRLLRYPALTSRRLHNRTPQPHCPTSHLSLQPARATTIVAVDIGTYGSGFSYVISPPNENARQIIQVHKDWPDRAAAGATGSGAAAGTADAAQPEVVRYPKTRSALLLRGGKGVAFGWTAVRMFCDMDEQERTDGRSVRKLLLVTRWGRGKGPKGRGVVWCDVCLKRAWMYGCLDPPFFACGHATPIVSIPTEKERGEAR